MSQIKHYFARALQLPPHLAALKAARLTVRATGHAAQKISDLIRPSYGPPVQGQSRFTVSIPASAIDAETKNNLYSFCEHYLRHEFDLLGSGWVGVGYADAPLGIEGIRFEANKRSAMKGADRELLALVNHANRYRAAACRALIADPAYLAIDWQRDFRSGFRWSEACEWKSLRIGKDRGADIKWPWELSRMQHLPQLALAAIAASEGQPNIQNRYVREIRSQILDFIASNPPRFGAGWGCPMDVGLRAANWVVTHGILSGVGLVFDAPFQATVTASLRDHAAFIAGNLEWSEVGRSNHYLSDLTGLLFAAAALPRTAQTSTWINFAARELANETVLQFHADGGNYEGSTSYHRLSAELCVYGLALITRLAKDEAELFEARDAATLKAMRVGIHKPEVPIISALNGAAESLPQILAFIQAMRRPDGRMVQIGDTDSGRLFKWCPWLSQIDGLENQLLVDEVESALARLIATVDAPASLAAEVINGLSGGARLLGKKKSVVVPPANSVPLNDLRELVHKLPPCSKRSWRWPLAQPLLTAIKLSAFPDFGLYCLTAPGFYLAFRCAAHLRADAPNGHTHDDNLALELYANGEAIVTDPGTYVYTSFPNMRNSYRIASAHFAPRANEFHAVRMSEYLFGLEHLMTARCLHASSAALAGVLEGPEGKIYRIILIEPDAIVVHDGVERGTIAKVAEPVKVAIGYGKKTARAAFTV